MVFWYFNFVSIEERRKGNGKDFYEYHADHAEAELFWSSELQCFGYCLKSIAIQNKTKGVEIN
jgi:hypothetical protein